MVKDKKYFSWAKSYWTPEEAILLSMGIIPPDTQENSISSVPSEPPDKREQYQSRLRLLRSHIGVTIKAIGLPGSSERLEPKAFLDWAHTNFFTDMPDALIKEVIWVYENRQATPDGKSISQLILKNAELQDLVNKLSNDKLGGRGKIAILKLFWASMNDKINLNERPAIKEMLDNGYRKETRKKLFPNKKITRLLSRSDINMDEDTVSKLLHEALIIICDEKQNKNKSPTV